MPNRTRSKGLSLLRAAASAVEVARVSDPARAGSQARTPRSTPIALASEIAEILDSGPMESAVTVPPRASLIRRAVSKTGLSKGFSSVESCERTMPASGAFTITDLIQTIACMIKCLFIPLVAGK